MARTPPPPPSRAEAQRRAAIGHATRAVTSAMRAVTSAEIDRERATSPAAIREADISLRLACQNLDAARATLKSARDTAPPAPILDDWN